MLVSTSQISFNYCMCWKEEEIAWDFRKEKIYYVTNEESDNKIVEESNDEGDKNMINMVILIKYYVHEQQGK